MDLRDANESTFSLKVSDGERLTDVVPKVLEAYERVGFLVERKYRVSVEGGNN